MFFMYMRTYPKKQIDTKIDVKTFAHAQLEPAPSNSLIGNKGFW